MTTTNPAIQEIVIARILAMPDNIGVSIGGDGEFTKDELIKHVKADDDTGKKMVKIQLAYLQSLKDLTNQLVE